MHKLLSLRKSSALLLYQASYVNWIELLIALYNQRIYGRAQTLRVSVYKCFLPFQAKCENVDNNLVVSWEYIECFDTSSRILNGPSTISFMISKQFGWAAMKIHVRCEWTSFCCWRSPGRLSGKSLCWSTGGPGFNCRLGNHSSVDFHKHHVHQHLLNGIPCRTGFFQGVLRAPCLLA